MAEVRKRIVEDKYNTSKIKKSLNKKSDDKKSKSNEKKTHFKKTNTNEKKNLITRFRIFCHGVKSEFLKVHWPSKKDMVKYSVASIAFIIFCSLFFFVIDILFALVQSLFI